MKLASPAKLIYPGHSDTPRPLPFAVKFPPRQPCNSGARDVLFAHHLSPHRDLNPPESTVKLTCALSRWAKGSGWMWTWTGREGHLRDQRRDRRPRLLPPRPTWICWPRVAVEWLGYWRRAQSPGFSKPGVELCAQQQRFDLEVEGDITPHPIGQNYALGILRDRCASSARTRGIAL